MNPALNLRSRVEVCDFDYIDKLSDKEKEWLNTFAEEFNNANFNHGKKILNKTPAQKKDCYSRNNARNRDILSRQKAMGQHIYIEELKKIDPKLKELLGDEDRHEFQNSNDDANSDTQNTKKFKPGVK